MHSDIMRLDRHLGYDLFIESHSAGFAAHDRQNLIIITPTSPQSAAVQVEGYTRNENKVQPV